MPQNVTMFVIAKAIFKEKKTIFFLEIITYVNIINESPWIKSGNLGHQANSDISLQTVEIQMRRLLMSRLIRIFTVFIVYLFLYSIN